MNSLTKLTVVLIGGVVVVFILHGWLLKPNLSKIQFLASDRLKQEAELVSLEQQVVAFKNAQSDLARASKKEKILNAFLIREDLVEAIKDIEAGASKSVVVLAIAIKEPGPKDKTKPKPVIPEKFGNINEIPYQLTTESDFEGIVKFLEYLEHLPQFTEVSKVELSAEIAEINERSIQTGKIYGFIEGVFFVKGTNDQ